MSTHSPSSGNLEEKSSFCSPRAVFNVDSSAIIIVTTRSYSFVCSTGCPGRGVAARLGGSAGGAAAGQSSSAAAASEPSSPSP